MNNLKEYRASLKPIYQIIFLKYVTRSPVFSTISLENVTGLTRNKISFTVPVSNENKCEGSDAHYITAVMQVMGASETYGLDVSIFYYRPDLVTVHEVLTRFAEIVYVDIEKHEKYINGIINAENNEQ